MSAETLETARLRLRPMQVADAPRVAALMNDKGVVGMLTRAPYPYARKDAEDFLAHCRGSAERPFAIDHPTDGLIGVVGFHGAKEDGAMGPEVGYWLGRPYWGQGYATEALTRAVVWASHDWGRRCLVSGHFADNPRSGNVLVKAGFLYTGEVKRRHSVARGEAVPSRQMVWLA